MDRHIRCPGCNGRGTYRLGDGRRKCKRCGRRFTQGGHKNRLPGRTLKRIAMYFWLMVPAIRASENLGLNRKTVQRYFRILRQGIADLEEESERVGADNSVDIRKALEGRYSGGVVFGMFFRKEQARITVLYKNGNERGDDRGASLQARMAAVIYAESLESLLGFDPDRFHPLVLDRIGTPFSWEDIDRFFLFAGRMQQSYRGRVASKNPQLFRELEFRFNHRDDPEVIRELYRIILG